MKISLRLKNGVPFLVQEWLEGWRFIKQKSFVQLKLSQLSSLLTSSLFWSLKRLWLICSGFFWTKKVSKARSFKREFKMQLMRELQLMQSIISKRKIKLKICHVTNTCIVSMTWIWSNTSWEKSCSSMVILITQTTKVKPRFLTLMNLQKKI